MDTQGAPVECQMKMAKTKGNEKPTRDLVRKVFTDDTDTKWASTLLTTWASKGRLQRLSCVSLTQILTLFRLSLNVACHSNNLPVISNHLFTDVRIQNYVFAILSLTHILTTLRLSIYQIDQILTSFCTEDQWLILANSQFAFNLKLSVPN